MANAAQRASYRAKKRASDARRYATDEEYRQRQLQTSRERAPSRDRHKERTRLTARRGLLRYRDVLALTGLSYVQYRTFIGTGAIPAVRGNDWRWYTVEQVTCLVQAVFHATIKTGVIPILHPGKFAEYVKEHWPREDDHEQKGQRGGGP